MRRSAATRPRRELLRLDGLTKRYGGKVALDGLDLSVHAGEVDGLLGPNGSGKSTALHLLTGIIAPTAGYVTVAGVPIGDKRSRRHLGFAPDDLPLPYALTGQEYLAFHASVHGCHDRPLVQRLTEAFGLGEALEIPLRAYSHGMKRKIQVVAAVAHLPEVLVLDEPFRGLDPGAAILLRILVSSYARSGRGVVIATHDLVRAERDCDLVNIVFEGRSVAAGSPWALVSAVPGDTLEDVFLAVTGEGPDVRSFSTQMTEVFDGDG